MGISYLSYIDKTTMLQVLGCLMKNPSLLENKQYKLDVDDFGDSFHKIIFGTIVNLKLQGAHNITITDIDNYLSARPHHHKTFIQGKGTDFLATAFNISNVENFDYYYNRLKKMSVLRAMTQLGIDVTFIYNPNTLDLEEKHKQEQWLDDHTVEDIVKIVDEKLATLKANYVFETASMSSKAGDGLEELIYNLQENPEIGVPLFGGGIINTVTRGARLKKFYLRSAPTGIGKTRLSVADAGYIACRKIYNIHKQEWEDTGFSEPTVFITTELELQEIQTMLLAFVSGVQEENILNGDYRTQEDMDRVLEAANIIKESPLWIEHIPDFSLEDIETIIMKHVQKHNAKYIFFDYIHTSLKILEEITTKANGVRLREDVVLLMMATRLKDICNEHGVFIMSATQLNGDWMAADIANQNLLRGSKAIADKIDLGMIVLPVEEDEVDKLNNIIAENGMVVPNMKICVYKNRRGRYKDIIIWCNADLGICRINPLFITDNYFKLIGNMQSINISIQQPSEIINF